MEYSEAEILTKRIELAQAATQLGEEFFSNDYIKKNILKMSEVDIDKVESDKDLEATEEEPEAAAEEEPTTPEEEPSPEEQA